MGGRQEETREAKVEMGGHVRKAGEEEDKRLRRM